MAQPAGMASEGMASSIYQRVDFLKPTTRTSGNNQAAPRARIFTSTNKSHAKIDEVRELLRSANLSCHRFPKLDSEGRVEAVDPRKLSIALSHSTVVVSVFSSTFFPPQGPRQLVGFGRAVSDDALTASIHDVAVLPCLQGLGIGSKIVNKIIRILTSKGIYDISALCSENQRSFFQTCGFGDDILESTTMVYTKSPSRGIGIAKGDDPVLVSAGRKLLLIPLLKKPSQFT